MSEHQYIAPISTDACLDCDHWFADHCPATHFVIDRKNGCVRCEHFLEAGQDTITEAQEREEQYQRELDESEANAYKQWRRQ